jgi:hypothetical protein
MSIAIMSIVNCTPHAIVLFNGDIIAYTIEPSGATVRLLESDKTCDDVYGVPCVERTYCALAGLPDPVDGTYYLVSIVVLGAAKALGRTDCISPDTGAGCVRDAAGKILGTRGFVR